MNEVAQPLIKAHAQMQESLKPVLEHYKRTWEILAPLVKQRQDFHDFIQRIEKDSRDTRDVMLESGWWLTPSMMDVRADWINDAVTKYKGGNKKAVFDLFRKVYQNENCKNLEAVTSKWKSNSFLVSWSSHIDDALGAHKQKKYTLSVPVLLLVAEGVAGEFCKQNRIPVNESSGKDKIEKSTRNHYQKTNNILLSNLDLLEGALSSRIYENTRKLGSKLRKNVLNRHAVLHGLKKNYGSMKTSLQAFMLIDMLSELS